MKRINTLVIGAGQGGIATSEHLRRNDIEHVVLERGRIAERWRSERWDPCGEWASMARPFSRYGI